MPPFIVSPERLYWGTFSNEDFGAFFPNVFEDAVERLGFYLFFSAPLIGEARSKPQPI